MAAHLYIGTSKTQVQPSTLRSHLRVLTSNPGSNPGFPTDHVFLVELTRYWQNSKHQLDLLGRDQIFSERSLLVRHLIWDQDQAGSIPVAPTIVTWW